MADNYAQSGNDPTAGTSAQDSGTSSDSSNDGGNDHLDSFLNTLGTLGTAAINAFGRQPAGGATVVPYQTNPTPTARPLSTGAPNGTPGQVGGSTMMLLIGAALILGTVFVLKKA